MKKIITKLFSVLLAGTMLVGATSCDLLNSFTGENSSSTGTPTSSSSTSEEPEVRDYTITFHYGFDASATLDASGKPSAYKATADYISKKGKRVSLTTAMKDMFAVAGYKVVGYSTTAWQKDGITADMDVYVLYAPLAEFAITFQNPDGSVISTLSKKEGESLTAAEYPEESAIKLTEGCEFIGWSVSSVEAITENMIIKALEGSTLRLEAEKSNYYFQEDPTNAAGKTIVSSTGSGGKSVYLMNGTVVMDYKITAEKDVNLILGAALWYRSGAENKDLNSMLTFSVKTAGAADFALVSTSGKLTCTKNWGDFEETQVANISLKAGENVIRLQGSSYTNVDYIMLKGDVSGVAMNPHTLTLNGATFANGETTAKVEAGNGMPVGVIVTPPEGKVLDGWTDGTTTWTAKDFVMPDSDLTVSPVWKDTIKKAATIKVYEVENVTVDGVKDDSYTQVNSAAGHYTALTNDAISADVYMATKDNGVYVYVDVTDDVVVSGGKEYAKTNYKNDMIEFWFTYNGSTSKIQIDAFGHQIRSDADGLAVSYAKLGEVAYATMLKGDDKLAQYQVSGEATVSTATGYAVEFWLPLADAGKSVINESIDWTLQVNSISETTGATVSINGWQLKTESNLTQIDKIYTAAFVKVLKIEAEAFTIGSFANGDTIAPTTPENTWGAVLSGGSYITLPYYRTVNGTGLHTTATVEYQVNATQETTLTLTLALAHRDSTYKQVNTYFKLYVNDVEIVIDEDLIFSLEGWGKDIDGDKNPGRYYFFEVFEIGDITLKEGVNTIKLVTEEKQRIELDYLELIGDIDGVTAVTNA